VVDNWEKQLKNEIKGFQPKDVYNLDETALFYRLLPNKTYAFGDESRHGYKQFKERVTIVLISNADGTDKKAIMIGRSHKPRAFRGIKSLPIDYYKQQNSWINSDIFNKIIKKFDSEMRKSGRNVLLYIDSCPAHKIDTDLTNVSLKFLPKNSTSVLQVLKFFFSFFLGIVLL
jgi:hypothetical protein